MKTEEKNSFRVWVGAKKRKHRLLPNLFPTVGKAKQFCRNHRYQYYKMIVEHPDGTKESIEFNFDL